MKGLDGIAGSDRRLTAQLLERMKELLTRGEITPGCKLPPEREMARQFGVNRASLRQVLKVLEIMGVISQRVGDGTYLNDNAGSILDEPLEFLILLDGLSHRELFETRLIVEPELAARAAQRATMDDLKELDRAITEMANSRTVQARQEADMAFHEGVFRAAGNRICYLLFRLIHRTLLTSMAHLAGRVELARPLGYHREIYDAIYRRDAEGARQKMLEHIQDAQKLLEPAFRARVLGQTERTSTLPMRSRASS